MPVDDFQRSLGRGDALIADGTILRTARGTPVTLRGTNIGGWFMHEGWMTPAGRPSLDRTGWRVSASSRQPPHAPRNVIDGADTTTWRPAPSDRGPWWLKVDMGYARTIDGVSLHLFGSPPVEVTVEGSLDGQTWRYLGQVPSAGGMHRIDFDYVDARFVRVDLRGGDGGALTVADVRVHVTDEFHVRRQLEQRFGETIARRLIDAYQDAWFGSDDLDHIADLGFNVVRIPIHWQVLMRSDGTMRPDQQAFRKLDWVVTEASQRGLYTILDLHGAPGGANPWHSSGQAGMNRLWSDLRLQSWTERLWRRIAGRYVGAPGVAGYDLLNEPEVGSGDPETSEQVAAKHLLFDRLYRAVRSADPGHVIFMPAFPDPGQAPAPVDFGWENVAYETHHFAFAQQADESACAAFVATAVAQLVSLQATHGVPIFVGEFWLGRFTSLFGAFTQDLEAHGISWATWTYKTKNGLDGRDFAGVDHGRNWSLLGSGPDATPDLDRDEADEIEAKWRSYVTSAFLPNLELAAVLRRSTRQPVISQSTGGSK